MDTRERAVALVADGGADWAALDAICETAQPAESESIALSLLYVLGPRARDAVAHAVVREVAAAHGQLDMLRGNTAGVRSFVYLARFGGQQFLEQAIGPVLRRIRDVGPPGHQQDIVADTHEVLSALLSPAHSLDPAIAAAISAAGAAAAARFGEPARAQAASTLFYLRYVCPAIVSPELYALFPRAADLPAGARLRSVARVVQCVANGTALPRGQAGFDGQDQESLDLFIRESHERANAAVQGALARSTSGPGASLPVSPRLREEAATVIANYLVTKMASVHKIVADRDQAIASQIAAVVHAK
jgi:hypothetical protein